MPPSRAAADGDWIVVAVGAIATLGLALRMYGVDHGYPDFVTGDERAVIKDVVRCAQLGTLEPGHFNYPALYSYLLLLALGLSSLSGSLIDVGDAAASISFAHLFAPGQLALIGRCLNVAAGAATVAASYRLGALAYDRRTGLGAAVFASCCTVMVHQSKFALPDVTMSFLAVVATAAVIQALRRGTAGHFAVAGAFIGAAASAKYNAGMLLCGVVAAHLLSVREAKGVLQPRLLAAGAAALTAFLAGSPYWLFVFDEYWGGLLNVSSNLQFNLAVASWPRLAMLGNIVGREWLWGALLIAGCGYAAYRRSDADLVLLAIVVPSFLYIGSWPKAGLHYAIFLFPLAGVLAARLVSDLVATRAGGKLPAILFAALSVPQVWMAISAGHSLGEPNIRSAAARWIEANIPDQTVIGVYRVDYTPPLKGDIHRRFLNQQIAENRHRIDTLDRLQALRDRTPIYTQLSLEYFRPQPRVPTEYRATVDLADPKPRRPSAAPGWSTTN